MILTAGDDAMDARWVAPDDVRLLPTVELLIETLDEWGLLPTTNPPDAPCPEVRDQDRAPLGPI